MGMFKRSGYWQDVNPTGAIADFITVFKQAGENRWRIGLLAAIATTAIFSVMWQEGAKGPPKPPKISYITTLAPGRSDAEIMASNRENQKFQDRLAAEQAKREEEVRQMYKALGRASGMDVDAIERKAKADEAAEKAAARQRAAIRPEPKAVSTAP